MTKVTLVPAGQKALGDRGTRGKTIVFGLLKRNDNVNPNCSRAILQGIIKGHVCLENAIHSDGWKSYHGLVDVGYQKHFRVEQWQQ